MTSAGGAALRSKDGSARAGPVVRVTGLDTARTRTVNGRQTRTGSRAGAIALDGHGAVGEKLSSTGGEALCWGRNDLGQLGDGSVTDGPVPTPVAGGLTFAWISAGVQHTCGVTTSGDVYCWGGNVAGGLGNGTADSDPHPLPELVVPPM